MNLLQTGSSMTAAIAVGAVGVYVTSPVEFPFAGSADDYGNVKVYSEDLYRTNYDNTSSEVHYTEEDKIDLLSEFVNRFANNDTHLSYEESKVISDDLFDLM